MHNTPTPKTKPTPTTAKYPHKDMLEPLDTCHLMVAMATLSTRKALTPTEWVWVCLDASGKRQSSTHLFPIYSSGVGLYLDRMPLEIFGARGFQAAKRSLSSFSESSTFRTLFGMS